MARDDREAGSGDLVGICIYVYGAASAGKQGARGVNHGSTGRRTRAAGRQSVVVLGLSGRHPEATNLWKTMRDCSVGGDGGMSVSV